MEECKLINVLDLSCGSCTLYGPVPSALAVCDGSCGIMRGIASCRESEKSVHIGLSLGMTGDS